ncbi:ribosomal protein S6 kinase-like 1 isoform X2 [Ostrinia furnacalis]|uniref:ribosomal protein S6 kinase-like 1 isoform X2 n=2 Tax=Ostrinia furnacalis TaxID=93504 RepID=UPI00103B6924|nr:ribosomal protein S6 kinase-like 1 isoform X2 [Ostrinia furnacalis]
MSAKDKWVRRFSVDETSKHKNGFTIYKITSVLFPIESPEAVSVVSVWKRYSDVQQLHKSMRSLHAGLRLRGTFPPLQRHSYFKRFQQEVIEERAKTTKTLLEFVAEHKLLFTSTDFVNFLQTGYPEPEPQAGSVINAIRSSLHLPIEETPPLEYQTDDDDARSPAHSARPQQAPQATDQLSIDETDFISQIPIYEAADVEIRQSPDQKLSAADSFESINSLDSINSDLYDELSKVTIDKPRPCVRKNVLPDLILFDAPSTSTFEDYHTMPRSGNTDSETTSLASNVYGSMTSVNEIERRSSSKLSLYSKRSVLSLSNVECKTKTEDSYVFEAGYMLNLAARCENMGDFQRAFECYKSGIEKMLIGVQSDSDPQRRALIKEKTNKYLSYAEAIYKNHLCDNEQSLLPERDTTLKPLHCPLPAAMLKRPYEDLALYRVLAVLSSSIMLVLHREEQTCYAMKVIQKIPHNLTEFDEYFLQRTKETREPVLPTVIPYMVPLHAFIETNNLIFLILSYAPGEKLFDYIKNYAKSIPNTPAREVNLENVFSEPKIKTIDVENDNIEDKVEVTDVNVEINEEIVNNNEVETTVLDNSDLSVNEIVSNSQKLLKNVDKVLSEMKGKDDTKVGDKVNIDNSERRDVVTPNVNRLTPRPRDVLPPSAVCKWGAEILTAIESLHNCGVICRDLNPSNVLLGSHGQVILTYFISYPGLDMALSKTRPKPGDVNMYVAPELYYNTIVDERDVSSDKLCDYWSFGAVMYELLCGVPLSYYHRSVFTSHTILQLPDGLSVEVESLLTQLLTYEPSERLGAGKDGIDEIKRHPYFKGIDWRHVYDTWLVPD